MVDKKQLKKKQLRKKQFAVIEDLFSNEFDEQAVLKRHDVTRNVYNKWLEDDNFSGEFNRRISSAHRQSRIIIAKYASLAAAKLVELTESDKEETARKACIDIINLPKYTDENVRLSVESEEDEDGLAMHLSEQTVSRLLAILAEDNEK